MPSVSVESMFSFIPFFSTLFLKVYLKVSYQHTKEENHSPKFVGNENGKSTVVWNSHMPSSKWWALNKCLFH